MRARTQDRCLSECCCVFPCSAGLSRSLGAALCCRGDRTLAMLSLGCVCLCRTCRFFVDFTREGTWKEPKSICLGAKVWHGENSSAG